MTKQEMINAIGTEIYNRFITDENINFFNLDRFVRGMELAQQIMNLIENFD